MGELDVYLARLTLSGYRPMTVQARGRCLRSFATHTDLLRATREDCEAYLARPLAQASRRAYADHLRSFYRYLVDEGLRGDDPTERLPQFRRPRGIPRPIGEAELRQALDRADPRMLAWLLLMCMGGLRCMEVAGLRPKDLVAGQNGALLRLRETKGGKTATVPAHASIVTALSALPVRRGAWWQVGAHYVSAKTSAYLRELGIDATAHQLRHYAGTAWYAASGNDLLTTARLLRHADVSTTQGYSEIDPQRPAEGCSARDVPCLTPDMRKPPARPQGEGLAGGRRKGLAADLHDEPDAAAARGGCR